MYVKREPTQSNTAENPPADDADIINEVGSFPVIAHLMRNALYTNPIAT